MIKTLLFTLICFVSFTGLSAILTVNNNSTSPGQYTSLQVAIDAASIGDTLLIHRSLMSYGNAVLTKKLNLIGEGVMPNKSNNQFCEINELNLTYDALGNATGCSIKGININNLNLREQDLNSTLGVNNISVENCRVLTFSLLFTHSNLYLVNNYFVNLGGGILTNSIMTNNFFNIIDINNANNTGNVINNNIVMTRMTAKNATVMNNIFYNSSVGYTFQFDLQNCSIMNNIAFSEQPINLAIFAGNGNSDANNQINVNPQFTFPISYSDLYYYSHTSPAAGPFANFHLQASSPGVGAGLDGTDIGLYGGVFPWRDGSTTDSRYRYFPLTNAVPQVLGITINTPVVMSGGTLQLQLNATTNP